MADHQQQHDEDLVLSFFPDPPPFYKHFTPENLERLKDIEQQAPDAGDDKGALPPKLSAEQILALPTELRYLIPPEPPADDEEFHVFGEATKAKGTDTFLKNMQFISTRVAEEGVLQAWKYEQLYPTSSSQAQLATGTLSTPPSSVDRQAYLFRFLRSILLSYMSLLGIVALNPVSPAKDDKTADILTLVTNMHALINEYRPHQARETLIAKMEEQVQRKRGEVEGVRKISERVREVLRGFGAEAPGEEGGKQGERDGKSEVGRASEEDKRRMGQRRMWRAMDELLG
ncbi:mediator of RNA polymerase II transcription subunit 7 [Pyrenochaeta sp. DS3sAY3a]|nr:mediator of RNA polymerase II transcription subunit 7 [Pyrenochaeta sp. DS3sAY3a]